jgi:hypothetical protein
MRAWSRLRCTFALLLALADLGTDQRNHSGAPLKLATDAIAEKFAKYYRRLTMPYAKASEAATLQESTDRRAAIREFGTRRARRRATKVTATSSTCALSREKSC